MTSTDVPTSTPPAETPPKPSSFSRLIGVLMAPNDTFASIARQPDWVMPLVLWLVVSLIGGIIVAQKVDFAAAAREAMEQRKNIPPDAIERGAKMAAAIGKVSAYAAPVFAAILFLIVASALWLAFRLFGSEGTFRQAFSATIYAWVPNIIQNIILLIVLLTRSGLGAEELQTAVRSNLGFLVDLKTHPMAFAALTSLDIFTIWALILFVIGFAYESKFSKAKSAGIVIPLWAVVVLLKLIPAALRSMNG